jgi:hypothetical protein
MQWSQPPPPPPPPPAPQQPQWQPPPLPADDRIKQAVRAGQVFDDRQDAARAVTYAQSFLKTGHDVSRPPVIGGILIGLAFTVALQFAAGYLFLLVIPVGLFIAVLVYLAWFSSKRGQVEQSLEANRRVAGG